MRLEVLTPTRGSAKGALGLRNCLPAACRQPAEVPTAGSGTECGSFPRTSTAILGFLLLCCLGLSLLSPPRRQLPPWLPPTARPPNVREALLTLHCCGWGKIQLHLAGAPSSRSSGEGERSGQSLKRLFQCQNDTGTFPWCHLHSSCFGQSPELPRVLFCGICSLGGREQ